MMRLLCMMIYWLLGIVLVLQFMMKGEFFAASVTLLVALLIYFALFFTAWKKKGTNGKKTDAPIYWNMFISDAASDETAVDSSGGGDGGGGGGAD